ncbi:MAG: DUF512 domain-containing protein [Ruminococcaceae bacterium]|nr:DUF512 domain-containing protein [Oscillospiraceae bacterium]
MAVTIFEVQPNSLAHRAGIRAGESLLSINGHEIRDVLDYRFRETERVVVLSIADPSGNVRSVEIKKGEYQPLGLDFESYLMDSQRSCRNKCVFCFIDQLPKGLRDTLYFKDDDERLSFLFGNYITLTNLSDAELDRIIEMHISPINVSVHTTDPALRVRMMANPAAAEIMPRLRRLAEGNIALNCQMVLCPGWNDGEALERSLADLEPLAEHIQSIALVPVGLTAHREGLADLRLFTAEEAARVVDTAQRHAEDYLRRFGKRLVWAADEFYITAGREFPAAEYYDDYPQLENGVGLSALLHEQFEDAVADTDADSLPHRAVIATGVSAAPFIEKLMDTVSEKWSGADIHVHAIINRTFGETITVAGLVTGGDIAEQLAGKALPGDRLLIPCSMLRREGDMFLDSMTTEQLEQQLGVKLVVVDNDGYALLDAVLGID